MESVRRERTLGILAVGSDKPAGTGADGLDGSDGKGGKAADVAFVEGGVSHCCGHVSCLHFSTTFLH